MQDTAVLNIVGITPRLLQHAPFLQKWAEGGKTVPIDPVLPAVTCSVQSTFLTGKMPSDHGIVGNGWYFRDESEIKFWRQSNKLVQAEKVWEHARAMNPAFTCANMFWWYNMYSSVDYSVTPRPMYPADGRKIPDVYTQPSALRFELQEELGQFPLFEFWGPNTTIRSSQWIAKASMGVHKKYAPTLTLIYLPHLDYVLQQQGPDGADVAHHVQQIDGVCQELIEYFLEHGVQVMVLSEYGITNVEQPVHLNRALRRRGYIAIREELGRELLDAGGSEAFAVADHQLAHVYVDDDSKLDEVRTLIESIEGVDRVLDQAGKAEAGLDHPRAGDLVAIAAPEAWFTYYYWLNEERAPDFAHTVDIHRKPGYDPVELFVDPELRVPKLRVARRLVQKKLGFRYLMDVIPLDASLVKGSHGRLPPSSDEGPLLITPNSGALPAESLHATDVRDVILAHLRT